MNVKKILCVAASVLVVFMSGCGKNEDARENGANGGGKVVASDNGDMIAMPQPGKGTPIKTSGTSRGDKTASDKAPETAVTPEAPSSPVYERVSFMGCGDNITYYGNVRDAQKLAGSGEQYNFRPIFRNVKSMVESADIAFINQETVMAEGMAPSYYPRFNSPRKLGTDLLEIGYDVINIANNHMLDKGDKGLESTIDFWKQQDCLMIGGYENAEDYDTIRTMEKNGIKIAFLSYTYGTNGINKSASSPLAIPYIKDEDIIRQTAKAKESAEFVMVSVHWGDEGAFVPNAEQKRVAQLMADCGVDAIIGHHPHVIQPVEWLTGKDGNKTLCVYSLGNFAAEQAYAYNMVGGIISFDIVSVDNGKPYVENPIFTPTVFHFDGGFYDNTVYFMKDYTEELAKIHGVRTAYGRAMNLPLIQGYVDKCIDPEFLPKAG